MLTEQEQVQQIMQDMSEGDEVGNQLIYDERTKTIRPAKGYNDPDKTIVVTPSDLEHFGSHAGTLR